MQDNHTEFHSEQILVTGSICCLFRTHRCEGENCNNSQNQENHGTSLNTYKEINNFSSKKKRRHSPGLLPFIGLTHARELNRNCCQNGGTCFLGTFCICPKYLIKVSGLTKENPPDWMQVGPRSEGLSLQHKAYLLSAPTLLPLLWQLL